MHVSDLIDDLAEALATFPEAAGWRIGVATYTDGPGSDISVMHVASVDTDADDEFFLVPEGMGEAFGLAERPITAKQLLDELRAHPEWAGHPVCVRSEVIRMPDGSLACRSKMAWGAGVHEGARLVYFYYGAVGADA